MKKFAFITTMIALGMTSCVQSPEDKANKLIEAYIKSSLKNPETYEFVETKIDSAFTPYCDPAFHEDLTYLIRYTADLTNLENEIINEQASADKNSAKIDELSEQTKLIQEKGSKTIEKIRTALASKPTFIGYKTVHQYRAKNTSGEVFNGEQLLIIDKDFTKIELAYDMDSDAYRLVKEMITKLKEGID